MYMQPIKGELPAMNNLNSLLNQHQISSLQEIHNHAQTQISSSPHDDFLDQMLSFIPSSASSFPWANEQTPPSALTGHLDDQSAAALASKMRHHQISNGAAAAKALMLQQQLWRLATTNGQGDQNDVVDGPLSKSANVETDASIKSLFRGFSGSMGQTPNQPQHFSHTQGQSLGAATSGGGGAAQPRQKVRARRGQATDPHSIAERLRRERIAERMKGLQELVPNANKTDKASMLDEIIDYVKFLQLQVKVLSMSRLGGAATVAPLVAQRSSSEGRSGNGTQTTSSSKNNEGMTVAEKQVAKLMEEDMGAAMQYLQGKGLCLMPISLATAISTATSLSARNPLLSGEAAGPTSPSMSVLTVQSAAVGGGAGGGELARRDATPVSKP